MMSSFAQKQVFQLQLVEGMLYKQIIENPVQIEINDEEMEMNTKINLNYKVLTKESDFYKFEVNFDFLLVQIYLLDSTITLSSDLANGNTLFNQFLNEITKNSFFIKTDKKGQVLEITGYNEMLDNIMLKFPTISDENKQGLIIEFKKRFYNQIIEQNINSIGNFFPSYPVGIGDEWDFTYLTYLTSLNLNFSVNAHYKLVEINPKYITITVEGKITSPSENDSIESKGKVMKYNMTGTLSGTYKIDPKTFWKISSNETIEIYGIAKVTSTDQQSNELNFEMSFESDILSNDGSILK